MTTNKAVLIPWEMDKDIEVIDLEQGNLDAIYDRIAPESRLFSVSSFRHFALYYDDEGLYTQPEHQNLRAMVLWGAEEGVPLSRFRYPLVGNYLVVGPADDEGENTDVPEGIIRMVQDVSTSVRDMLAKAHADILAALENRGQE
jgi:hypothetical protein